MADEQTAVTLGDGSHYEGRKTQGKEREKETDNLGKNKDHMHRMRIK
jgi:hypothetical protein